MHVQGTRWFQGTLAHFLEVNDRNNDKLPQLNILWFLQLVWPFDSQPGQSVILPKLLGGQASADWKQWIIRLLSLHITLLCYSSARHKNARLSLWLCSLNSSPLLLPSISLSLQPSCVPSIIISDPQMTLRDSCYLKHMHSSSRQCDGERGERGEEEGRGGVERWRSTRLTSSFLLLCPCIMHGTAVHISRAFWTWSVYTHTHTHTHTHT